MSEDEAPTFTTQYQPPKGSPMAHPKQAAPMNKLIKQMMKLKLPKNKKLLQRRTKMTKKKYRII